MEGDAGGRGRGAPRGPRPWPTHAAALADDLTAAMLTTQSDAAGLQRQAAAIGRLADTCVELLDEGNILLARRMAVDIARFAKALGARGIGERAQWATAALKKARAGEYGE